LSSIRYAIYLAPGRDSELWRFGSLVVGRDAASGRDVEGFATAGYTARAWRELTRDARAYGFHATLKAPFRLNISSTRRDLETRIAAIAARIEPFDLGPLGVGTLPADADRAFVALRPETGSDALTRLEASVVRGLDPLRAILTEAEIRRRRPERLSSRQRYYLEAWGYPYVLDEFRPHFTLTGAVAEAEDVGAALSAEFARRVSSPNFHVDSLALFAQPAPAENFEIVRTFPLGA
jgi:2'-5' RNA ligase